MADDSAQLFAQAQAAPKVTNAAVDALALVDHLTWRGNIYPVSARSASFRHEQVEHTIQYRANDYPEPIGPHSFLFRYTFPMREGIAKGPYKNLFNVGLTVLVRDCRNKEPGELFDPFYGKFRVVPVSFEETTDITRRDGTDVQVEFLHAPHILDGEPLLLDNITGIQGLASQAGLLDQELKAANFGQIASPQGLTSALSAINGAGRRALRQIDRVSAQMDHVAFELKSIEDTADAAENPQNWRLRDSARSLRDQTIKAKERLTDPTRKIKRVTLRFAKTIGAIAADAGMSLKELLDLNPRLGMGGPMIAAGTEVKLTRART